MKTTWQNILVHLLLPATCFLSCTHPYEQEAQEALLLAEENRSELEKVLAHFQDDPDPLRRKSAWFLVANMPYHGRFEGKDVEAYDSAYTRMAEECPELRDSTFKAEVGKIGFGFFDTRADIIAMKADYLIRAIDAESMIP